MKNVSILNHQIMLIIFFIFQLITASLSQASQKTVKPESKISVLLSALHLDVHHFDRLKIKDQNDSEKMFSLIAESQSLRFEIETTKNISVEESEKRSKDETKTLDKMFGNKATPYSGEISNRSQCTPEKKPMIEELVIDQLKVKTYLSFANDRWVIGSCDDASLWVSGVAFFYDSKNKNFHFLRIFSRREQIKDSGLSKESKKVLELLKKIKLKP